MMADKEDLIPISEPTSKAEEPSRATITKEEITVEAELSPTSSESVKISSTSAEVRQSTSKKPEKQKSEEVKDSKHDEENSSATPTLFEKFVRSFDSVLHDLSAGIQFIEPS